MPGRSLVRLLVLPWLLLAAAGCGAPATPAAKPSIRIVSPASGSTLTIPSFRPSTTVTIRFSVSHFTLVNFASAAQSGSGQIRLYENGKLWGMVTSNSISLGLGPGSYQFKAELVTNGKVVATSAPVAMSLSASTSVTLPAWCNTRATLSSTGQSASTVSVRLTCLPGDDQIFRVTGFDEFYYAPDSSGNLWFVVAPPFGTGGSNAPLGIGRITPAGSFSLFSAGVTGVGSSPFSNSGDTCPWPLTPGPGGMWFSCSGTIGRIGPSGTVSLFTTGLPAATSSIGDFVPGLGGDMWFVGSEANKTNFIGKISPSGTASVFTKGLCPAASGSAPASCQVGSLTLGPGGNMWFTGNNPNVPSVNGSSNPSFIGKITPSGAVTLFTQGLQQMCTDWAQSCLHPGPGSDMLFYIGSSVEPGSTGFGLITPSGSVTRFTNDLYPSAPCSPQTAGCGVGILRIGPSGDIWLAGAGPNHASFIDRISPSGTVTRVTQGLPASTSSVGNFVPGVRGDMWFLGSEANKTNFIGRISPSGTVSVVSKGFSPLASCSVPTSCFLTGLTLEPGGDIWFIGNQNSHSGPFIGKVSPSGTVSVFSTGLPAGYGLGSLVLGPTGDLSFWGMARSGSNAPTFFGQISPSSTTANLP